MKEFFFKIYIAWLWMLGKPKISIVELDKKAKKAKLENKNIRIITAGLFLFILILIANY